MTSDVATAFWEYRTNFSFSNKLDFFTKYGRSLLNFCWDILHHIHSPWHLLGISLPFIQARSFFKARLSERLKIFIFHHKIQPGFASPIHNQTILLFGVSNYPCSLLPSLLMEVWHAR